MSGWHCEEKRKIENTINRYKQYVSRSCELSPLTLGSFFLIRPPDTSNVAPPVEKWRAKAKAPMELLPRRGPKRTVSVMLKGSCSTGCLACSVVLMVSQVKRLQIQSNSQVQNDIAASHSLSPLYTNYLIDLFNPLLNTHGHLSVLTCHVGRGCYKPNQMICRCGCTNHLYPSAPRYILQARPGITVVPIDLVSSQHPFPATSWLKMAASCDQTREVVGFSVEGIQRSNGCTKMVHVCVL